MRFAKYDVAAELSSAFASGMPSANLPENANVASAEHLRRITFVYSEDVIAVPSGCPGQVTKMALFRTSPLPESFRLPSGKKLRALAAP